MPCIPIIGTYHDADLGNWRLITQQVLLWWHHFSNGIFVRLNYLRDWFSSCFRKNGQSVGDLEPKINSTPSFKIHIDNGSVSQKAWQQITSLQQLQEHWMPHFRNAKLYTCIKKSTMNVHTCSLTSWFGEVICLTSSWTASWRDFLWASRIMSVASSAGIVFEHNLSIWSTFALAMSNAPFETYTQQMKVYIIIIIYYYLKLFLKMSLAQNSLYMVTTISTKYGLQHRLLTPIISAFSLQSSF